MAQANAKKKVIPVGPVKCAVCTKTVYQMEQVAIDGLVMHDKCFKCAHCNKKLSPGTCSSIYGKFYCKPHFMSLFKSKGNYNEGFGEEKDQHKFNAAHGVGGDHPPADAKPAETSAAKPAEPAKPAEAPKPAEPAQPAPAAKPAEAAKPTEAAKPAAKTHDPVLSYNAQTKKHNIEYQTGKTDLALTAQSTADGVFISNCTSSVITVTGKLSSISLLNCTDTAVVFENIIASVEVNRGKKIQLQANGSIPQILFDSTEGATVFLSNDAQSAEIICAHSELINIIIPGDEDDMELPVPSQYVTRIVDGKLVTEPATHV